MKNRMFLVGVLPLFLIFGMNHQYFVPPRNAASNRTGVSKLETVMKARWMDAVSLFWLSAILA